MTDAPPVDTRVTASRPAGVEESTGVIPPQRDPVGMTAVFLPNPACEGPDYRAQGAYPEPALALLCHLP
jgi:hypothetical protein